MRLTAVFLVVFFFLLFAAVAAPVSLDDIRPNADIRYYVRLAGGDILTGPIVEVFDDEREGPAIKVKTAIGTATVYASQIEELTPLEKAYPHSHRVFIMPTAEPISNNHFIGLYELLFLYGGAGIADIVSVTAGRSVVPSVPASEQVSVLNLKATVYREEQQDMPGHISFALGANFAWLNDRNRLINLYGVGTFTGARARITGALFYKAAGEDVVTARAGTIGSTDINYARGAVGVGVGLDTRLTNGRYDLHVLAELWNHDVGRPSNTAVLLGLRLWNTDFSADFGIAFFTAPAIAPVANFVWTPF